MTKLPLYTKEEYYLCDNFLIYFNKKNSYTKKAQVYVEIYYYSIKSEKSGYLDAFDCANHIHGHCLDFL